MPINPAERTADEPGETRRLRPVAVIMDGDGGRAAARGLPRFEGHRRGVEALRRAVPTAIDVGLGDLTVAQRIAAGELALAEPSPEALGTAGIPDPDLVIRTSGEQRPANFLLGQAAHSELVFLPMHGPDVDRTAFDAALPPYAARERRYGGVTALPMAPARAAKAGP